MTNTAYNSFATYELLVRRAFADAESIQKFRCYNAYRAYSLLKDEFNFKPKKFNEEVQFEILKKYLLKTVNS